VFALSSVDEVNLHELARECSARLSAGHRLLTLFGRRAPGDRVIVSALLEDEQGELVLLRARALRGEHYPSLTVHTPCAHMLERELWEQTGVVPAGHPWLKPLRFEGERKGRMAEYPFYSLRGKEVHEVGVGPIHAGVIEPGHFRFMCLGEVVHHLELQLGYQHRGVESLLLSRPPLALTPLVESIVGDSCIAYAWAYCAAMEALGHTEVQPAVEAVRGIALELERIAMHLAGLSGLTTDIAFMQGAATYGRLRTAIINATMRLCGSRFGRGWLRPFGVRAGLSASAQDDLRATLSAFSRDIAQVNELVLAARTVQGRFQGVGTVKREAAVELGLVGLVARASGVDVDARRSFPGELWTAFPVEPVVEQSGDCWARLCMRMREVDASTRWILRVLDDKHVEPQAHSEKPPATLEADALCISIREGFRGRIVHALETDRAGGLLHYKLQDPSLQNWFGLAMALRENEISDFPICNKSFDLSYCGHDL
jgi:Ni,Fe-hydrogenase III large subunit